MKLFMYRKYFSNNFFPERNLFVSDRRYFLIVRGHAVCGFNTAGQVLAREDVLVFDRLSRLVQLSGFEYLEPDAGVWLSRDKSVGDEGVVA